MSEQIISNTAEFTTAESSNEDSADINEGSELKSAVARAADRFSKFAENTYEKRIEFQNNIAEGLETRREAIKGSAKNAGENATDFFKKISEVGKGIGLATVGVAIMGASVAGEKVGKVANSAKESYEKGKIYANGKVESGKDAIGGAKEKLTEYVDRIKADRQAKRAEALVRKDERKMNSDHAEAIRINDSMDRKSERKMTKDHMEAIKINNSMDRDSAREAKKAEALIRKDERRINREHAETIRANNAKARAEARKEKIESIKSSAIEKKDKLKTGASDFSQKALDFFNRAKEAGKIGVDAAKEAWQNYEK